MRSRIFPPHQFFERNESKTKNPQETLVFDRTLAAKLVFLSSFFANFPKIQQKTEIHEFDKLFLSNCSKYKFLKIFLGIKQIRGGS